VWQFFTLDLKRVGDIFHVPNAPEAEVSEDALKDHHT
jgi:hypothetical protein